MRLVGNEMITANLLLELVRKAKYPDYQIQIDLDFCERVLAGGHFWALSWKYPQLSMRYSGEELACEVGAILQMWDAVETAYETMCESSRCLLRRSLSVDDLPRFTGFDSRSERSACDIADLLAGEFEIFARFRDREFASGRPVLHAHRCILEEYARMTDMDRGVDLGFYDVLNLCRSYMTHTGSH